jgi:hypothetical protein
MTQGRRVHGRLSLPTRQPMAEHRLRGHYRALQAAAMARTRGFRWKLDLGRRISVTPWLRKVSSTTGPMTAMLTRERFADFRLEAGFARDFHEPLHLRRAREGDHPDATRSQHADRFRDLIRLGPRGIPIRGHGKHPGPALAQMCKQGQSAFARIELHANRPASDVFSSETIEHTLRCRCRGGEARRKADLP